MSDRDAIQEIADTLDDDTDTPHAEYVATLREELDFPMYYVSGEELDADIAVPAYYRVDDPTGPVAYVNPNSGPYRITMWEFAMEAQGDDFRAIRRAETPWPAHEERDADE